MDTIGHKKGKIYYSMGEVAEMFDVNATLIRFWESKFDILKPHKNKKGNRMFTPQDVDNLKLIYHLVKEQGMTLAGAQKRLKQNPEGISRDMEINDRLLRIRSLLMEIREELKTDGNEVYHDEDTGENEISTVVPKSGAGKKPAAAKPAEHVPAVDLQAEEEWLKEELEEVDELSAGGEISPLEADELLEAPEELAGSVPDEMYQEDEVPAAAMEVYTMSEVEITEEELQMLDDEPEPDYPAESLSGELFAEAVRPDDGVQSLFGGDAASEVPETPEEPKPRIIEQTLF